MATFAVDLQGATYEVDAPDPETAWKWANISHMQAEAARAAKAQTETKAAPESTAMREGRRMSSPAQGAISALQGPTFGFLDELAGAGAGVTGAIANLTPWGDNRSFGENYRSGRDKVRGATQQYEADYPITSAGTRLAAAAPSIALPTGVAAGAAKTMGAMPQMLRAGATATGYGAASGLGESAASTALGMAEDTARGAAISAALGSGGQGLGRMIGAGGSNVAQRVSDSSATGAARVKLAELLRRDARGAAFQPGGGAGPSAQVAARLRSLGAPATIADAAGESARAGLDVAATLPGRAKGMVEDLIHTRQAGRAGRLVEAADEALGTAGRAYTATLDALVEAKKKQSKPFYDALKDISVRVDDDLHKLLQAAGDAHGGAEKIARLRREVPLDISKIGVGDDMPFRYIDKVKQSLYDLGDAAKGDFGKPTNTSAAYDNLRRALIDKMDAISPKGADGVSIYKRARNAFSSHAELEGAVKAGRDVLREDAVSAAQTMAKLTAGEREAFRVGVLQAVRDKVGTEGGQTSLLKMWKEPATSDKLRAVFGNNYREFAAAVARERALKPMEQVGRGSQTAARMHGAAEFDAASMAAQLAQDAGSASRGNLLPAMGTTARAWNQVKTPEATRTELARLLLMGGPQAQRELQNLPELIRQLNASRAQQSTAFGAMADQLRRLEE